MKYMLLIYSDEQAWDEAERERCYVRSAELAQQLRQKGQYLAAAPLHPTPTATSVPVLEIDGLPPALHGEPEAEAAGSICRRRENHPGAALLASSRRASRSEFSSCS